MNDKLSLFIVLCVHMLDTQYISVLIVMASFFSICIPRFQFFNSEFHICLHHNNITI